mmetsp:Transcript_18291/g.27214  ORF Transcript_18291/g.27214 Transcript_18291/m.27214 type:complete len:204 (-) Transcript_18291:2090-2701(-)
MMASTYRAVGALAVVVGAASVRTVILAQLLLTHPIRTIPIGKSIHLIGTIRIVTNKNLVQHQSPLLTLSSIHVILSATIGTNGFNRLLKSYERQKNLVSWTTQRTSETAWNSTMSCLIYHRISFRQRSDGAPSLLQRFICQRSTERSNLCRLEVLPVVTNILFMTFSSNLLSIHMASMMAPIMQRARWLALNSKGSYPTLIWT